MLWYADLTASAIIVGLITSSIVAGLAPTVDSAQKAIYTVLHRYQHNSLDEQNICLQNITYTDHTYAQGPATPFSWQLGDRPEWLARAADTSYDCGGVLGTLAAGLSGTSGLTYAIRGVPVADSAIGTPFVYGYTGYTPMATVQDVFGTGMLQGGGGPLFQSASQCFPVLARNPVRCGLGQPLLINKASDTLSIDLMVGNCVSHAHFSREDIETVPSAGATTTTVCTSEDQSVGQATLAIGSVGQHEVTLMQALSDAGGYYFPSNLLVSCIIDIAAAVEFRKITILRSSPLTTTSPIKEAQRYRDNQTAFAITGSTGDEPCIPRMRGQDDLDISYFLSADALAAGASGSWLLWHENADASGWWPTLGKAILSRWLAGNSFAFQESRNQLEDVLGMASGIALGSYWGTLGLLDTEELYHFDAALNRKGSHIVTSFDDSDSQERPTNEPNVMRGSPVLVGQRIGSGSSWALLFAVPPLVATSLLIYRLTSQSRAEQRMNRRKQSEACEVGMVAGLQGKCATKYTITEIDA